MDAVQWSAFAIKCLRPREYALRYNRCMKSLVQEKAEFLLLRAGWPVPLGAEHWRGVAEELLGS